MDLALGLNQLSVNLLELLKNILLLSFVGACVLDLLLLAVLHVQLLKLLGEQ